MHISQIATDVLSGALIGLSIAVPVGPSCILCIQRCLAGGRAMGLATGLGISTAHAMYATLTLRGSGEIVSFVGAYADVFKICSVCLLFMFAARAARSVPRSLECRQAPSIGRSGVSFGAAYGSALFLGLTNPMTMLYFLAVIPSLTGILGEPLESRDLSFLVLGVASGSFTWWSVVVTSVGFARDSLLDDRRIRVVNRASALCLFLVGLAFLVPVLKGWMSDLPPAAEIMVHDGASKGDGLSFDREHETPRKTFAASK